MCRMINSTSSNDNTDGGGATQGLHNDCNSVPSCLSQSYSKSPMDDEESYHRNNNDTSNDDDSTVDSQVSDIDIRALTAKERLHDVEVPAEIWSQWSNDFPDSPFRVERLLWKPLPSKVLLAKIAALEEEQRPRKFDLFFDDRMWRRIRPGDYGSVMMDDDSSDYDEEEEEESSFGDDADEEQEEVTAEEEQEAKREDERMVDMHRNWSRCLKRCRKHLNSLSINDLSGNPSDHRWDEIMCSLHQFPSLTTLHIDSVSLSSVNQLGLVDLLTSDHCQVRSLSFTWVKLSVEDEDSLSRMYDAFKNYGGLQALTIHTSNNEFGTSFLQAYAESKSQLTEFQLSWFDTVFPEDSSEFCSILAKFLRQQNQLKHLDLSNVFLEDAPISVMETIGCMPCLETIILDSTELSATAIDRLFSELANKDKIRRLSLEDHSPPEMTSQASWVHQLPRFTKLQQLNVESSWLSGVDEHQWYAIISPALRQNFSITQVGSMFPVGNQKLPIKGPAARELQALFHRNYWFQKLHDQQHGPIPLCLWPTLMQRMAEHEEGDVIYYFLTERMCDLLGGTNNNWPSKKRAPVSFDDLSR